MPRKSSTAQAADLSAAIAERAYFKAMHRGFVPGFELEDWLAAEREVAALAAPAPKPRARRSAAGKSKKV